MRRGTRILLASGVILAGIACALTFRKPPTETSQPRVTDDDEISARATAPRRNPLPDSVPRLLGQIDPWEPSAGAASSTMQPAVESAAPSMASHASSDGINGMPARTRIVRHKIGDGDTLTSLARRYLGDGSRFQEIFAANRGRLSSADVLPIGAEIEIPVGPPPAPPTETAEQHPLVPVPRRDGR